MRFAGRTIIVTGAAGGLGSAMAAGFAREGGTVAVVDLPGSPGAEVAARIGGGASEGCAFFVPWDLAGPDGTAARWRPTAGAVGAAGVPRLTSRIPSRAAAA